MVSPVNADLEDEAIAAVSQWEFSPTYLNCEPIEVRMFVTRRSRSSGEVETSRAGPPTRVARRAGYGVPCVVAADAWVIVMLAGCCCICALLSS